MLTLRKCKYIIPQRSLKVNFIKLKNLFLLDIHFFSLKSDSIKTLYDIMKTQILHKMNFDFKHQRLFSYLKITFFYIFFPLNLYLLNFLKMITFKNLVLRSYGQLFSLFTCRPSKRNGCLKLNSIIIYNQS